MLLPSEVLLFSPCRMVTATTLKWRGASVTVGNLVAAITVRVIVDGADGVCALGEVASATVPSSSIPVIGIRILASSTDNWKHHTRSFHGKAPVTGYRSGHRASRNLSAPTRATPDR